MINKNVSVQINKNLYIVKCIDPDNKELRTEDPERELLGKTNCLTQEILIRNDLKPNRFLTVLIHELTHAFIDSYGFSEMLKWNDEQVCVFFETYGSDIVSVANNVMGEYLK